MNKEYPSSLAAVDDVFDGATIMFGGFGEAGIPENLIRALVEKGVRHLTAISNSPGADEELGLYWLLKNGQIDHMIASYPSPAGKYFTKLYQEGKVKLELRPQGTLAEQIRAGGAGIAAFYVPVGVGTTLAEGKETRSFNGEEHLLEHALKADFAFVKAYSGDRWGNLCYRRTARNFNPIMAMAGSVTIAEVEKMVPLGDLDPEAVVTPGIFVNRIVRGEKYEKAATS